MPAAPPPATMAAVHFIIGGRSAMVAADRMAPAITATGAAMTSSKLSTPGMKYAPTSRSAATPSMSIAAGVPSHAKPSPKGSEPE
jgi:hypothetical protein